MGKEQMKEETKLNKKQETAADTQDVNSQPKQKQYKISQVMFRDHFASPTNNKLVDASHQNIKSIQFVENFKFIELKSVNSVPGQPAALQTRLIPNDGMNVIYVIAV